jgi:RNA recognition motif-containing protein
MNIYVSGLNYSINDAELADLFGEYGTVTSANVILDKMTNRSRGFGFVEMESDEDGQKAIDALNDTEVKGKKLVVNVARPREERPSYGGGGRRGGGYGGGRR